MPIAADAKGPVTMRQAVISYACGTGRRRRSRDPSARREKAVAAKAAKQKAAAAKSATQ